MLRSVTLSSRTKNSETRGKEEVNSLIVTDLAWNSELVPSSNLNLSLNRPQHGQDPSSDFITQTKLTSVNNKEDQCNIAK